MPPARFATYAASFGVALLPLWSVLVRPLPLGWSLAAFGGYVALVTGGVLSLGWRVFVDAVVRGPQGARGVVLTFDDGPHPFWTARILDVLREHGAKATFFVVGRKVEDHPEVVHAILEQGHAVELHSYAHDRLLSLRSERRVRQDLERGIASLERATGRRPALFRPPIGHTNPILARIVNDLDLTVVGWTIAGRDGVSWARPNDVVARVRRDLRDGAIVLLHDAPERGDREPAAVRALPAILAAIAADGLQVVPLARWIGAAHDAAAEGSTT
jgi:peptidoglycan/xylan/chitin deacetylase (PgdA/CDA1 family)